MNHSPTILAIGDVHIGTRCSSVPDDIHDLGVDPSELSPAAALENAVEFAISHQVQAVLFAGDVVENTNARFEAIVPLEHNVRRLVEEGIQVIAVAGNHDVEALPRLADLIDGFTLLGAGGQWESQIITENGEPVAEIIGWSFRERVVRESPVATLLANPLVALSPSIPRLGILHADLDASGGNYAPVKQSELEATGLDAWFLGHIHKPSLQAFDGEAEVIRSGYLGSLVSLDPSESGRHGPWLVELPGGKDLRWRQLPLSPVRWETLNISVDGFKDVENVPDLIFSEMERFVHQLRDESEALRALGLRIRLVGANVIEQAIRSEISRGTCWNTLARRIEDTAVFVNKVIDAMDPYVDLEELAAGDDPAALMARRILALGRDDQEANELLATARSQLQETTESTIWQPLRDHRNATDPLSDDTLRELLLQAGRAALGVMLTQKEERDGQ